MDLGLRGLLPPDLSHRALGRGGRRIRLHGGARVSLTLRAAVSKVNAKDMLLVFPSDNTRDPPSLWYEFFPRSRMNWEWDEGGDDRVPKLWHLREQLSSSGQVVYAKWFRGRATMISRALFVPLRASLAAQLPPIGRDARELLEILEDNSPLSTKALKKAADLQGRDNEARYTRALRELWERLLIVGYGEVDDGAFPSLAIGAAKLLFEELWHEAAALPSAEAHEEVKRRLPAEGAFRRFYDRLRRPRT